MKRFLLKLSAFLAIHLAVGAFIFVMRPVDPRRYLAASRDKHAAAERAMPPPRILILGGSGSAFSFDSPTMKEVTGIKTVNLSQHIGLGPYYMLNEARDLARAGDVIVICFEYELYRRAAANETLLTLLESCPERREYLSWRDVPVMLDNGFVFYGTVLRNTLRRFAGRTIAPAPPYSRDALNDLGDLVKHRGMPRRKFTVTSLETSHRPLGQVIGALNDFDADMRARGVRVFLTYPAVPHEYFARNARAMKRIQDRLETELSCPILGTPQDALFEFTDFFDTQYHVTGDAPIRRTRKVAEMLRRRLPTTMTTALPMSVSETIAAQSRG